MALSKIAKDDHWNVTKRDWDSSRSLSDMFDRRGWNLPSFVAEQNYRVSDDFVNIARISCRMRVHSAWYQVIGISWKFDFASNENIWAIWEIWYGRDCDDRRKRLPNVAIVRFVLIANDAWLYTRYRPIHDLLNRKLSQCLQNGSILQQTSFRTVGVCFIWNFEVFVVSKNRSNKLSFQSRIHRFFSDRSMQNFSLLARAN